jgi:hypothetical protein
VYNNFSKKSEGKEPNDNGLRGYYEMDFGIYGVRTLNGFL